MIFRQLPDGVTNGLEAIASAGEESSGLQDLFESLYDEHYGVLYRYLVLTGSSPADADELAQEAFLRLLRALKERSAVRNAKHWLFRVAHNLRTDWRRQSGRQTSIRDEASSCGESMDPRPDPEAELLQNERTKRLGAALAQLTARQSEILHLRAEGLKLREIAELLGVSLQTVSESCARAVDRIGRLLND